MQRRSFVLEPQAPCLEGHFPGRPVIPGVVLLDAAITAFALAAPLRIVQAKFLRPCLPGMVLDLVLTPAANATELRIEHDGELMASARIQHAGTDG